MILPLKMGCDNTIAIIALVIAVICFVWLVLKWISKHWFTGSRLDKIIGGAGIDVDINEELSGKDPITLIKQLFMLEPGINADTFDKYIADDTKRVRVVTALKRAINPTTGQPYLERDDFDDDYMGHNLSMVLKNLSDAIRDNNALSEWTYNYIYRYLGDIPGMKKLADEHKPIPRPDD